MLLMPEPPHRSCQGVNMPRKNVLSFTLAKGQSSVCMCVFTCVQYSRVCVCACLSVCVDKFLSVGFTICMSVGV